ncbi:exocyst complex component Sec10-domain-containing protein [Gaertneriomyces semiglobifer]|nr:exocyst complex component Sec10-domain-containing protein [Gaertneriomyces semiglobifer]
MAKQKAAPVSTLPAVPKSLTSLPPDILIKIIAYVPVPDLSTIARASRRLKILAYNDEVYEPKLGALGVERNTETKEGGEADADDDLVKKLRQMPGGHLLPGRESKYLETGSLWSSLETDEVEKVEKITEKAVTPPEPSPPATQNNITSAGPAGQMSISSTLPGTKRGLTIGAGGLQAALNKQTSSPAVGRRVSSGIKPTGRTARDRFKQLYTHLSPYYLDFRHHQKDSKVFQDIKDLSAIATTLHLLRLFSNAHFIPDCDDINFALETTVEWFESMVLGQFERAYDSKNVAEMKKNAEASCRLNGGAACVQLFISKNPVFFDPTFNPALVKERLPSTTEQAAGYALADDFAKFSDYTLNNCREQARLIADVFPPESDALTLFVNKVYEDSVAEYLAAVLKAAKEKEGLGIYLHTLATGIYCCMQFADYISHNDAGVKVNTDAIKQTVVNVCKPYTDTYLKQELSHMKERFETELKKYANRKNPKKPAALDAKAASYIADQDKAQAHKRAVMKTMKTIMFAPVTLVTGIAGVAGSITGLGGKKSGDKQSLLDGAEPIEANQPSVTIPRLPKEDNVTYHLDDGSVTSMISLELCLHLMHSNKEALGRVLVVTNTIDPTKIRTNVEKVFVMLLETVGEKHIRPAFENAIQRLSRPQLQDSESKALTTVSPDSLQFFELVHIADLVHQMIEVYYQEDVKQFIDESDFLSAIVTEKKEFERLLDDCVAGGMDKSIQVLINQIDYVLLVEQGEDDFAEMEGVQDLKPTKACRKVIECLESHVKILWGLADKGSMEIYFGEVGLRVFTSILKSIKRHRIAPPPLQLITDINTYYAWACSLRVGGVKKQFEVLKEVGNLFLVEQADELRKMIHDGQRWEGYLRVEEVVELVQCRTDWMKVKKGLEGGDCCIQ